ncbi:MAG: YitT family protein [Candidatus Thermoplasmatota archaeon]|nr:YitT family protein [Candidatus Thermoplasmatota archaeon]
MSGQRMDRRVLVKVIKDYLMITLGSILMSLGLLWFLDPYKVSAGGVSGISIILRSSFGIPLGLGMLALNIPIFLLGIKVLGKRFGIRTFYGLSMFSLSVDLIDNIVYDRLLGYSPYLLSDPATVDALKDLDPLLAAIFGGVMLGAGLGLVFRAQGSTGGSDIFAQIAVKYRLLTAGQAFLIFDFFVITAAAVVFGGVGFALIGFVALFVSSKTLDVIVEGIGNTKGLYVVSDEWEAINRRILREIDRGVTILHGRGGYSKREKEIIFCVVTRRSIYKVRQIVIEEDPTAFMVISDLHEVYGLGFKPQKEMETPL